MHASQFGGEGKKKKKKCSQQRLEVRARDEDLNTFASLEAKTDEEKRGGEGGEERRRDPEAVRSCHTV